MAPDLAKGPFLWIGCAVLFLAAGASYFLLGHRATAVSPSGPSPVHPGGSEGPPSTDPATRVSAPAASSLDMILQQAPRASPSIQAPPGDLGEEEAFPEGEVTTDEEASLLSHGEEDLKDRLYGKEDEKAKRKKEGLEGVAGLAGGTGATGRSGPGASGLGAFAPVAMPGPKASDPSGTTGDPSRSRGRMGAKGAQQAAAGAAASARSMGTAGSSARFSAGKGPAPPQISGDAGSSTTGAGLGGDAPGKDGALPAAAPASVGGTGAVGTAGEGTGGTVETEPAGAEAEEGGKTGPVSDPNLCKARVVQNPPLDSPYCKRIICEGSPSRVCDIPDGQMACNVQVGQEISCVSYNTQECPTNPPKCSWVCGNNGVSYCLRCQALREGVRVEHTGKCHTSGQDVTARECNEMDLTDWARRGCGAGSCNRRQRREARSVKPGRNCVVMPYLPLWRCVGDSACR